MEKLLEVITLTKVYRNGADEVVALKNVSLPIFTHDYVSVVGPSGAGKSTLLHSIGGLEPPSQGAVVFKEKSIYQMKDAELSAWRNTTVGFVFQFYHLIEELNICENITLSAVLGKRKSSFKRAQELLKYLGIEARGNFFPSQLSGGERQKVAIARALINDPQIILCDEPTGNLDSDSEEKVIDLLGRLHREQNKTIILVTHNLELAKKAERVLYLKDGKLNR
ncbi:MAG: ABC transporter ATP-binding protein [Candidatus Omnitrophota bacterium]|nr:MAG: ABC transporter ATP-binding protein [Candidatus Omnitrophota bacterium]